MGGWKLEVFKMALYVSFPVGLFHYCNQTNLFEEWVIEKRKQMYPEPEDRPSAIEFRTELRKIKERQEKEMQIALEKEIM